MKAKILFSLAAVSVLFGWLSEANASTANEFNASDVGPAGPTNIRTGDIVIRADGRRYIYVAPGDDGRRANGPVYRDGHFNDADTYGARTAANETRQIAAVTAEAETRVLNDRIMERIDAAMHQSSPNAQGVFALGNGGMNAGDHGSNVGVWAQAGWSRIRDSGGVSDFKGNLFSGTVGVDYLFTPCFLAGLAFTHGYMTDGKYSFRDGKYKHKSFTTALYAALILHEFVSLDAMLAYGRVHKDFSEKKVTDVVNHVLARNDPDLKGSTDSRRLIGSIFANVRYAVEMVNLWLRFGYLHTNDKENSFNMSMSSNTWPPEIRQGGTINIGNLSGRLRAGVRVNEMVEPYLQGGVNYNVVRTKINADVGPAPKDRRFGWMVGGGLRLFGFADSTTGGVQYTLNKRGDLKVHNVTLDVRHDF